MVAPVLQIARFPGKIALLRSSIGAAVYVLFAWPVRPVGAASEDYNGAGDPTIVGPGGENTYWTYH